MACDGFTSMPPKGSKAVTRITMAAFLRTSVGGTSCVTQHPAGDRAGVLPALHGDPPVQEDHLDALGVLVRVLERGRLADPLGREEHQVGLFPDLDRATIIKAELGGAA